MEVGKAIYDILINDTDVNDLVSGRIYPVWADLTGTKPFLIYKVDDNAPSDTKDSGQALDQIQLEIFSFAETYDESSDLMKKVRDAIDRYSGTNAGVVIQSIQYLEEKDDFDQELNNYITGQLYKVRVKG